MEWRVLFALFAVAWLVRLVGLDYGYFHGDERVNQAALVLTGDLIPEQHFYPPFMHYILALLYIALFGVGLLAGVWENAAAFRAQYFEDPTIFYLVARGFTGAMSALMAPLFYRIGRVLSLSIAESLFIALLAVLAPSSIYLSYIFKGDVAMATASVLSILFLIRKLQSPQEKRWDYLLGIAVVLGLSFKHVFVFLAFHYYIAFVVVFSSIHGLRYTLRATFRILLIIVVLWPILNIGIFLDLENFLEFQRIQSIMSTTTGGSLRQSLAMMIGFAVHWELGLGYVTPMAFLVFPILAIRFKGSALLIAIWAATCFTIFLVVDIVRLRQPEHLWVSYFMVAQLFAGMTIVQLFRTLRPLGAFVAALAFGVAAVGTISIWQQTTSRPINEDIATYIKTGFADRRVMSTVALPLERSLEARQFERALAERSAQKYNLVLPELAQERMLPGEMKSYFVVPPPVVMYGLEGSSDAELEGIIKPFAWPPQPEDWSLRNWLADGIDLFVVADLDQKREENRSPLIRQFYEELADRCRVITLFKARKPIFLEADTTVLDCQAG